jgi:predicted glycoside hydrolase/deacetylase ChbG (UPF0249 family)
MARRLIVNADDFGFTRDVNLGIVEAHCRGILTAATLMANGPAFEHAVELAREHPGLDVGCHLVLVGGRSVADPGRKLPGSVRRLGLAMGAWMEREMEAQVDKILAAGLRPSHLDTHKHTHLAPPVLRALCRVAERRQIPWVRRPFDLPLLAAAPLRMLLVNAALQPARIPFDRTLRRYRCRTTDYFAGFQITGRFRAGELAELIQALPDGLTEFMCHPGYCTDELRSAPTRLKESRAEELAALVSEEVRRTVEEAGVRLVSFRD